QYGYVVLAYVQPKPSSAASDVYKQQALIPPPGSMPPPPGNFTLPVPPPPLPGLDADLKGDNRRRAPLPSQEESLRQEQRQGKYTRAR
ncbi:hypothetical protein CEP51_016035, partial [Fusarium floridanum]